MSLFVFIQELLLPVLVLVFFFTQLIIPAARGRPLFPMMRKADPIDVMLRNVSDAQRRMTAVEKVRELVSSLPGSKKKGKR